MASTTNITTTFPGKHAIGYIVPALFKGKTLDQGLINIHANVQYKLVLQTGSLTDMIASANCDFTPTGTLTMSEVVGSVTDLEASFQQCISGLEDSWESLQMTAGALNSAVPATFEDFLIERLTGGVSQQNEYNLWRGNMTGTTAEISGYTKYTGLLRAMDTTASVIKATKTAVTVSNVTTVLTTVFNLIDNSVRDAEDFRWFVSIDTLNKYRLSLAGSNSVYQFDTDRGDRFMNFQLVAVPGMPTDLMALGKASDFHFLTDLVSDYNNVRIVDTRETLNDDNIRVRMKFRAGTAVTNGAQLLLVR